MNVILGIKYRLIHQCLYRHRICLNSGTKNLRSLKIYCLSGYIIFKNQTLYTLYQRKTVASMLGGSA